MKKGLICLLAVCLLFAIIFTGCKGRSARAGDQVVYEIVTDTAFAPFTFENAQGQRTGIDMDILAAVAADQGFAYTVAPVGFHAALAAVEAGQADGVIAGMSITEPRKLVFDFSDPYFDSGVVMAIRADNMTIRGYSDLRGLVVAVKTGTEGSRFAESIQAQNGFELVYFDESPFMYEAVRAGHAAACFEDYPVMGYGISQGNGLKTVTEMVRGSSYGFAVRKDQNQDLHRMFNQGLANIRANGIYQQILDRYISAE